MINEVSMNTELELELEQRLPDCIRQTYGIQFPVPAETELDCCCCDDDWDWDYDDEEYE